MKNEYPSQQCIERYQIERMNYKNWLLSGITPKPILETVMLKRMPTTAPPPSQPKGQNDPFRLGEAVPVMATLNPAKKPKPQKNEERTPAEAYDEFLAENPFNGTLRVQVFTARRAFPVGGAEVQVSKRFPEGKHVIGNYITDSSGSTVDILLPTPSADSSLSPHVYDGTESDEEIKKPYSTYDITVKKDPYITYNFYDVPIFKGIVSRQDVDMIPITAGNGATSLDVYETEPNL